jgi:hypothetical protein
MAVLADTFANFSCEGHDCREYLGVLTPGNERMPSTDNKSLPEFVCANARLSALAVASLALAVSGTVSAADPPVTAEYRSAMADYRHFDAEAPAVDWREANNVIREAAEGGAHGMHEMRTPMESPPATGDTPPPATPDEPQEHPQ